MRPLQALKHSLQNSSSTDRIERPRITASSTQDGPGRTPSRHDAQVLRPGRIVPADPYTVWLRQREADREQEEHRLNPHAAWDNLRSQSFSGVGRG